MVAFAQQSFSSHPPRRKSSPVLENESSSTSKAYHATGVWGKRGMTFQELTRAFDAFNEAEERVAIKFAWSEDCLRKLEEPLSGVKTIFSDLDGLRPSCPLSDTPSSPSSSSSTTPIPTYQQPSILRLRTSDESGSMTRSYEVGPPYNRSSTSGINTSTLLAGTGADEGTIKPSYKRRRSLSVISSPEVSLAHENTIDFQTEDLPDDIPRRPASRLGFFDRDVGEDDIDVPNTLCLT